MMNNNETTVVNSYFTINSFDIEKPIVFWDKNSAIVAYIDKNTLKTAFNAASIADSLGISGLTNSYLIKNVSKENFLINNDNSTFEGKYDRLNAIVNYVGADELINSFVKSRGTPALRAKSQSYIEWLRSVAYGIEVIYSNIVKQEEEYKEEEMDNDFDDEDDLPLEEQNKYDIHNIIYTLATIVCPSISEFKAKNMQYDEYFETIFKSLNEISKNLLELKNK